MPGEADSYYQQSMPPLAGQPSQQPIFQPMQEEKNYRSYEETFKLQKPKYNDIWAGALFIITVLGFAALSAIAIRGYSTSSVRSSGINSTNSFTLDSNAIVLFAVCAAVALILGYGYVLLARAFPKALIIVTGILNIVFAFGTGIYYLVFRKEYWIFGIIWIIFGIFTAIFYWTCRHRIPFSALLLRTSVGVAKAYGHVFLVSLLGGLVAIALAVWFAITVVAIHVEWAPSGANGRCLDGGTGCSNGKVIGLIAFSVFTMYWMSEWLKNTVHTTVCGVYGSWFYSKNSFPHDATRGALKRSLTYSFGSISFGSLLVAIVNFIQQLAHAAMNGAAAEGDIVAWILFCILSCLISLLQWLLELFNTYAFVHVALYGKSYIKSAKDTWKMIKDRGFDALINECFIGPVLSFGALFVGYTCALVAYIWLTVSDPSYNKGGSYTAVIMVFSFLIGTQTSLIFTTPILSGIETIFVASAWDPEVLMTQHYDLYQEMIQVYPEVQQAIHA